MGKKVECTMRYQGHAHQGTAYLESDHLLFRGDIRLKLQLAGITRVTTENGVLNIVYQQDRLAFDMGRHAGLWAERIQNPPTRLSKLGLSIASRVAIVGKLDADFLKDLETIGAKLGEVADAQTVFYIADKFAALAGVAEVAGRMDRKAGLWIVYPKAVTSIREMEVLAAGRGAGLKDTKVVAFSKTHTALRFSQPLASSQRVKKTTA